MYILGIGGYTLDAAANEQSAVQEAHGDTLNKLAQFNQSYYEKFGFIFIICAKGKSAE